MSTKATPLLGLHRALGARLVDFAGWAMPLQYEGIIAEHRAVRQACGLFDVSHLGKLLVSGPDALAALDHALTCDVAGLPVGRARYGLVLAEDAGCVDDVFVYHLDDDRWLVVPNAANVDAVAELVAESGCRPRDAWDRWAILALQGPDSFEVFGKLWPDTDAPDLPLHAWAPLDISGRAGIVARTGYTGERGFEIYVPSDVAERTFESLLDAGAAPVGLGARDTLRLEMGYALYGHEIDRDTDPLAAGLGWACDWNGSFRGIEALLAIKAAGPAKRIFGIVLRDRGVPREGHEVYAGDRRIGSVVSGNFSPTLQRGIAQAYAPTPDLPSEGERVTIDARGRRLGGDIVKPPFIRRAG